jgi:hypothetical protein
MAMCLSPCKSRAVTGFGATLLSILMIAAFALAAGGLYLIASRRDRRKGSLMLVAAAVAIANVLIMSL